MSSLHRATLAMLALAALAACAGHDGSVPSPGDGQGRLSPQSFNSASPSPGPTASPSPVPSPSAAPPSGTLYVATTATVYAYPLAASGPTNASRSITPHPKGARVTQGIATNADGTLDVLQLYFTSNVEHCEVDVEPADANGSPFSTNVQCADPVNGQTQGDAVARNAIGGFDLLYNTTNSFNLSRYSSDGATLSSTIPLGLTFAGLYLSTDKGGHDYLANNQGEIRRYKPTATSVSDTAADCTFSAYYGDGPMAVAPDKTIYIVRRTQGNDLSAETILAITGCGTSGAATVSRTIGPYPNHYVSALAVDSQGELYVGLNYLSQNTNPPSIIRVYGPTANGKAVPVRVIEPSPSTNYIRGLAIYEAAP